MAEPEQQIESGPNARTIIRLVVFGVIFIYAVLFVALNSTKVDINFVFFKVQSPLWLGFIASLILGALLGLIAGKLRKREKG